MIDLQAFRDHCVLTRSLALHHEALVESSAPSDRARVEKALPIFIGDVLTALPEFIILQVCKLMDPPRDFRGNQNHCIAFLIEHYALEHNSVISAKLPAIQDRMANFRSKLEPARNKLIAHFDRAAVLAGKPLGAAPKAEWEQFWTDLDDIIDAASHQETGTGFRMTELMGMTDALRIFVVLAKAEAFDQMLADKNADAEALAAKLPRY